MKSTFITSAPKKHKIKKPKSTFSKKTSYFSYSLDGLATQYRQKTIGDYIRESIKNSKNPHGKSFLLEVPYPLITVISKRNIINHSSHLIKNLLTSQKNQITKCDEHLMFSKNIQINRSSFLPYMSQYPSLSRKSQQNKSLNVFSITQKKEREMRLNRIRNYLKSHDCNFYNREYFIKDPSEFYTLNAYKIQKLLEKDIFINKIKRDVSNLKFKQNLKAFHDI